MLIRMLASTVLAAALMQGAAFAQDKAVKSNPSDSASMSQKGQTLPQELAQKLKDQGFTDVKVVPGSFLVSAKDKEGDPVSMVIPLDDDLHRQCAGCSIDHGQRRQRHVKNEAVRRRASDAVQRTASHRARAG